MEWTAVEVKKMEPAFGGAVLVAAAADFVVGNYLIDAADVVFVVAEIAVADEVVVVGIGSFGFDHSGHRQS